MYPKSWRIMSKLVYVCGNPAVLNVYKPYTKNTYRISIRTERGGFDSVCHKSRVFHQAVIMINRTMNRYY